MALIELNLEKPALKRTETGGSSTKQSKRSSSEKTMGTEKSGEGTSQMVEMPEGERVEDEKSSGGGSIVRRIAMLAATAGAVMAVRKIRSRRKGSGTEQTEFEEEWERPHSE